MRQSWPEIIETFERLATTAALPSRYVDAIRGMVELAAYIQSGPLALALHGWTSMHALCIQQQDIEPYSGPYLRVAPQPDGSVEFRYFDTGIEQRQWSRLATAGGTVARLDSFLEQLHWLVKVSR